MITPPILLFFAYLNFFVIFPYFYGSARTYFHSCVSAHACPFRRLRRHLPRSRGRLFCESFPYFSILLILFSILLCLPTLTPFVNLSVDTFPDKRGQLTFPILFFMYSFSIRISWQSNSLVPSFLSGGQNQNDDRRKNII